MKAEELSLYATGAALMDGSNGRLLVGKEADLPLANASTTKILTAILVLELGEESDLVTISKTAASSPKVKLYLKAGEQVSVSDLLFSMMLESHNDSACALGEYLEEKSGMSLQKLFEEKLRQIGCTDTVFLTPNGLDLEDDNGAWHHTTARDLCTIMRYCILLSPKRSRFLEITRTESYTMQRKGKRITNQNAFLHMDSGVLSGKTGFTNKAGYCYVCAAGGKNGIYIIALLGCGWPGNKTYKWKDAKKLLSVARNEYRQVSLSDYLAEKKLMFVMPVVQGMTNAVTVRLMQEEKRPAGSFLLGENESVDTFFVLEPYVKAPVQAGQVLGKIEYRIGEQLLATEKLCAGESVSKNGYQEYLNLVLKYFLKKMQFALCELHFL